MIKDKLEPLKFIWSLPECATILPTECCVSSLTCCRLRDVHLWGLLLLGQKRRHTAQLREAAATTAATRGQTSTLQLLGLHLADVRWVRGCGGLGAERRGCVGTRSCRVEREEL